MSVAEIVSRLELALSHYPDYPDEPAGQADLRSYDESFNEAGEALKSVCDDIVTEYRERKGGNR